MSLPKSALYGDQFLRPLAYFVQMVIFEAVMEEIPEIVEGFQPRGGKCKQRPRVGAQFEQIKINIMKLFNRLCRPVICGLAFAALVAVPSAIRADGTNSVASAKPVPYPLDTCIVSGEKFGGDMGDPVVFVYSNKDVNQEIKFCCPMCKPKFLKNPDKYMKIIHDAEAKAKAKDAKN
jgi:hypothetical protein